MRAALNRIAAVAARLSARRDGEGQVHFHRGPDRAGYPAPCFDAGCTAPRLDA
jgi:hypothetical protein